MKPTVLPQDLVARLRDAPRWIYLGQNSLLALLDEATTEIEHLRAEAVASQDLLDALESTHEPEPYWREQVTTGRMIGRVICRCGQDPWDVEHALAGLRE